MLELNSVDLQLVQESLRVELSLLRLLLKGVNVDFSQEELELVSSSLLHDCLLDLVDHLLGSLLGSSWIVEDNDGCSGELFDGSSHLANFLVDLGKYDQ